MEERIEMKKGKTSILILHGIGGYPGIQWQPWLHDKLEKL